MFGINTAFFKRDTHLGDSFGRVKVKSTLYYRVWNGSYTLLGHEARKFLPKLVYLYCTSCKLYQVEMLLSWYCNLRYQKMACFSKLRPMTRNLKLTLKDILQFLYQTLFHSSASLFSKWNRCDATAARIQTPMVSLTFKKFDNLVRKLLWISCSNCHDNVKISINSYFKKIDI